MRDRRIFPVDDRARAVRGVPRRRCPATDRRVRGWYGTPMPSSSRQRRSSVGSESRSCSSCASVTPSGSPTRKASRSPASDVIAGTSEATLRTRHPSACNSSPRAVQATCSCPYRLAAYAHEDPSGTASSGTPAHACISNQRRPASHAITRGTTSGNASDSHRVTANSTRPLRGSALKYAVAVSHRTSSTHDDAHARS